MLHVIVMFVATTCTKSRQTLNDMRPRAGHSAVLQALCSDVKFAIPPDDGRHCDDSDGNDDDAKAPCGRIVFLDGEVSFAFIVAERTVPQQVGLSVPVGTASGVLSCMLQA